jgi:hypothetical protein
MQVSPARVQKEEAMEELDGQPSSHNPRRGPHQKSTLNVPGPQTSTLQNCEKIQICCFSQKIKGNSRVSG